MSSKETEKRPVKNRKKNRRREYSLILHNDEVHSFDYVIEALMDVCSHSYEQAVQCTIITHHKGSCDVRKGTIHALKPLKNALTEKELSATINSKP